MRERAEGSGQRALRPMGTGRRGGRGRPGSGRPERDRCLRDRRLV